MPDTIPLPGRADFPGAQFTPPEGWMRTYNEPLAQSGGMDAKMLKEAEAAVQAATRFQSMRAFQQDVESGVEPQKALLKHGPRMFQNSPAQFLMALHRLAPTPGMESGPAQTVPALDHQGVPVPGVHILRSPHGFHVIHEPPDTSTKQVEVGRKEARKDITEDLKAARSALATIPKASTNYAAQLQVVDQLTKKRDALSAIAPKATDTGKVRIKNKKTGEIFAYPASRKDEIPTDQFEIQ